MVKVQKTILFSLSAFFLAVILFLPNFALANGLVKITFEQEPLFQELNFLPGETITHWISVENISPETQPIGIEVINYSTSSNDWLAEQLILEISENSTKLYESSLAGFFTAGEIKLSDLEAGATTTYFFKVTFLSQAGDTYQGTQVSFDFRIGALGKESIGGEIPGGGGGYFIPGLTIFNEQIPTTTPNQVTITWETNRPATSRVIYSSQYQPHTLRLDEPPNYGYASSTPEDLTLVTLHQMVISGLEPATTYYFRCVSHGSLAISKELVFITPKIEKEVAGVEEGETAIQPPVVPSPEEIPHQGEVLGEETEEAPVEKGVRVSEEKGAGLEKFLAAVSNFFTSEKLCWLLFAVIIILILIYFLFKEIRKGKRKWILPLIILLAIILYCIFCHSGCWILILLAILFFLISLLLRRKEKTE